MARSKYLDRIAPAVCEEILRRLLAAHPELIEEALAMALTPETGAEDQGYYEVEVSLKDTQPRLWRRFLIESSATFRDLHEAIQDACGWTHSHLFAFLDPRSGAHFAGVSKKLWRESLSPDAAKVSISSWIGSAEQAECRYEYDFGDCWRHDVTLRRVDHPDRFKRRLVGGELAFPPEDCGGLRGYQRCAVTARTGEDPRPDPGVDLLEWLGGWHPDNFDLEQASKAFDRPRRRTRAAPRRS